MGGIKYLQWVVIQDVQTTVRYELATLNVSVCGVLQWIGSMSSACSCFVPNVPQVLGSAEPTMTLTRIMMKR